ncbi:transcriptional corepressor LEUNIG-like protein, partial [Trifolium pratense]
MDPSENLFRNLLYDYLKKSGLANTAESLQNEAQITGQTPPVQPSHTLLNCQARDIGAIMDTAPQIIREGYYLRHLTGFPSHEKDTFLSCDFSSDGKNVASGGFGKKPFICYPEPRNSVYSSDSHLSAILEVRFQPGSTIFATSSTD